MSNWFWVVGLTIWMTSIAVGEGRGDSINTRWGRGVIFGAMVMSLGLVAAGLGF